MSTDIHTNTGSDDRARKDAIENLSGQKRRSEKQADSGPSSTSQHLYSEITADMTARQLNGNVLSDKKASCSKHIYHNIKATNDNLQINGNMDDAKAVRYFFSWLLWQPDPNIMNLVCILKEHITLHVSNKKCRWYSVDVCFSLRTLTISIKWQYMGLFHVSKDQISEDVRITNAGPQPPQALPTQTSCSAFIKFILLSFSNSGSTYPSRLVCLHLTAPSASPAQPCLQWQIRFPKEDSGLTRLSILSPKLIVPLC